MKSMQLVFGKSESFYILTNEMESCFLRLIHHKKWEGDNLKENERRALYKSSNCETNSMNIYLIKGRKYVAFSFYFFFFLNHDQTAKYR